MYYCRTILSSRLTLHAFGLIISLSCFMMTHPFPLPYLPISPVLNWTLVLVSPALITLTGYILTSLSPPNPHARFALCLPLLVPTVSLLVSAICMSQVTVHVDTSLSVPSTPRLYALRSLTNETLSELLIFQPILSRLLDLPAIMLHRPFLLKLLALSPWHPPSLR